MVTVSSDRALALFRPGSFLLLAALFAAGCGGGGGGSSSGPPPTQPPTATPTPTPTVTTTAAGSPCGANSGVRTPCSVYSVNSNPSGLVVVLDGQNVGTTPVNVTPQPSYNPAIGQPGPNSITIQPGNGSANYTVSFNQLRNGNHQVYYNRVLDTQGSVSNAYSSTIRAQSLAQSAPAETVRRPPATNARQRPSIDPQHLFVKYQLAALQMGGRRARDIESVEGLAGGSDVFSADGALTRVLPIPA
ncbi:MAG: PEGA domain-containing protein, partial [Candidatus Eremiobacteraeota bacterium]|nr:PEGA domain-containing protein [Candidatus Eremiobacteraeota bacterium]